MSVRARISRLLLLNWKGLFFQPFELHEAVTALEGENGAGKTTVMIAAFVALLPDPQRLSFRNIGEGEGSGDGDRGIYGRLGDKGPSYSLLDLRTGDGARVVAGVCLLRGASPHIEFKRFVVEGLSVDQDLEALVLLRDGDNERIPDLVELREAFAQTGASMRLYETAGRYCGHLHELGILPMRMEQSQDRQRFHQMLHTSMYGGFSGALQKGLRDYLLNEDERLRNHVVRMRENLDACRITRRRIAEADARYRLIAEVFRFGWGMVEAAFHGTRLFAETRRVSAAEARAGHRHCRLLLREAALEHERLIRRQAEIQRTLVPLQAADRETAELLERCQRARRLRTELDNLKPRRVAQEQALALTEHACEAAQSAVANARERHRHEQQERDVLTGNLANAQDAFAAIASKVGQYHAALTSLNDARAALPDRELDPDRLDGVLVECEDQWQTALTAVSSTQQSLDGAETRRQRFDTLLAVLVRQAGHAVAEHEAAATACQVDAELRDLEERVARSQDLPERIQQAEVRARTQADLRRQLQHLVPRCGPLDRANQVREAHALQARRSRALGVELGDLSARCAEHRRVRDLAGQRTETLERDLETWRGVQTLADELRALDEWLIDGSETLELLRVELVRQDDALGSRLRELDEQRKQFVEEAEQLEFGGGRLDESLASLADRLDGQLVAERFDAVPAAEAAMIEARLGPLHSAVLVYDIAAAAATAVGVERRPEHLWLVPAGELAGPPPGQTLGDSELVQMGTVWRLSRQPHHPVVGRVARDQEIARLRTAVQVCEAERDGLRGKRVRLRGHLQLVGRLAAEVRWLMLPSPEMELRNQRRIAGERGQQLQRDEAALAALKLERTLAEEIGVALERCLPDAGLLDEEDWSTILLVLRREREAVQAARALLERSQADIKTLREGFLELQQAPPDCAYLENLHRRQTAARQILDYWSKARHLLKDLAERRLHFAYADQEPLLREQDGALGELREMLDALRQRVAVLEKTKDQAEQSLERARAAHNSADAALKATAASWDERANQLAETGEDGSAEGLAAAERLRADAAAELAQADREDRQLHADVAVAANCVDQADKEQARTRDAWRKTLIELRPNWRNWIGLRREAARLGVLDRLVRVAESYQALGPPNVMGLASERRGQLGEAVKNADGGMDLAQQLARGPGAASAEGTAGLRDLRAWGLVRGFLEQSIPRDIAQSDDPQVALEQIGQHLTLLRERLLDQEQSLRHSTEEIANSIQVKIRREEARIHGLNRGLARVRFGSIRGVRIHLERQPMMLKLLDAMRTQPDLFEQDAPLEDALAAVYQHLGGGQIQGEHLLDYRQYIRIGVQVQRLGRDAWMEARAGALSTGESIGVGAAVLVVILDAWEQQAALLKGRKGGQALRFLFLDEANRLSPESLDTLTELCEQMQVQLLAAAPAADRGRRGHIYRLVRRTDSTGAEEVIVRGRRMRDLDP
jgi:chromosome partition protein MukB